MKRPTSTIPFPAINSVPPESALEPAIHMNGYLKEPRSHRKRKTGSRRKDETKNKNGGDGLGGVEGEGEGGVSVGIGQFIRSYEEGGGCLGWRLRALGIDTKYIFHISQGGPLYFRGC